MPDPTELTDLTKKTLGENGEAPPLPPPVETPEYFPGFGKEFQQLGIQLLRTEARLTELGTTMTATGQRVSLRRFAPGPVRATRGGLLVTPTNVLEQEFLQAQAEFDFALQEFKSVEWRQEIMTTLPNYLSLPDYKVQSVEDILQLIPLDTITETDTAWLTSIYDRLKHLSNIIPDDWDGDAIEAQTKILDEILTAPKLELRAVHNLTVEEIAKSFAFGVAELPPGITTEDVRSMLGQMDLQEEEMKSAKEWLAARAKDWALETDRLNLIRAGTVLVEAPDLTPIQFAKLLVTQPMMATVQMLDKFWNLTIRPAAAGSIIGVHRLFKTPEDVAAGRLEEQYVHFKSMGLSDWEAYATAFNEWDAPWWMKLGIEIVFDPVSYIGLGFATAVGYKVGWGMTKIGIRNAGSRIGPWVGAIENGYITGADAIFKAGVKGVLAPIKGTFWLTGAGYQIPRTFTTMSRNFARDWYMKASSVLQKTYPEVRNMKGLTVKDAVDTGTNAIDQAIARPMEGGDKAVIAGTPMLEFDYIDDVVAARITKDVVEELTFDTTSLARLNNEVLNMFSGQGERITAGKIIADLGQEATEDMVNKMATKLIAFKEKVAKTAKESLKGDTATDVLMNQFNRLEGIRYANLRSPLTKYMQQAGRTASWHSRVADKILYSTAIVAMERRLVMPIARWNLLFTNFGPYNFLENMQRSFLGGAELMYPKAYSGVAETNRLFKGLANAPYELQLMERGEQRLAQALIDPKTGRTAVFKGGKIPFITKQVVIPEKVPFLGGKILGKKINIAGRDHYLASFQDGYDMWAHFNSMQVAFDYQTHYMKELAKIAPDDMSSLVEILAKHKGKLSSVKAISAKDAKDIERVLLADATVSPEGVRAHSRIDVLEFERRQISKELNRTMDKMTEVRSTTKKGIQDDVLDGSIFDNIDDKIAAYIEQERELSLISLKNQIDVLTDEANALLANPPRNLDEFMGDMQNITAMIEGTGERIHDYRKLTELRKAKLLPGEMDDFEVGSAKLLAEFMEVSEVQLTKIMNQMVDNAKGAVPLPREFYHPGFPMQFVRNEVDRALGIKASKAYIKPPGLLGKDIDVVLLVDDLAGIEGKRMLSTSLTHEGKPIDVFITDGKNIVVGKQVSPQEVMFTSTPVGKKKLTVSKETLGKMEPIGLKPAVPAKPLLNEIQLARLTDLDSVSRLELENILATRNKVAQVEAIIPRTPKKSRNDRFWSQQRNQKSAVWDEFETNARKFKSMRLRTSRNFLQSVDKSVYVPDFVPEVVDFLTPNHLAYLYGATGDDLYRGLTRIQHHATIRPREDFILYTVEQADAYAATLGKTAGDIGFTDDAIGEVYDQLWRNLGVEPSILTPDSPTVMQLEEIRQEITRLHGALKLPGDPLAFHGTTTEAAEMISKKGFKVSDSGILGDGVYLTSTREEAGFYGKEVLSAIIDTKNIYRVDITNPKSFRKFLVDIGESPKRDLGDIDDWITLAGDRIKAKGYDALEVSADFAKVRGQIGITLLKGETLDDIVRVVQSTLGTPNQIVVFDPKMVRVAKGDFPDVVNYRQYINSVADDVEKLGMYKALPTEIVGWKAAQLHKSITPDIKRRVDDVVSQLPDDIGDILSSINSLSDEAITAKYRELGLVFKSRISIPDTTFSLSPVRRLMINDKMKFSGKWIESEKILQLHTRFTSDDLIHELVHANFPKISERDTEALGLIISKAIKDGVAKPTVSGTPAWWTNKESAMTAAREQHALSYPTYDDANIIDEGMRAIFPFWNYEMFRWRWLPRTALRTPGAMTGVAKYLTNTDQGYLPVPATDLQINILRGSVWMGGLRSFYLRDFPEYYDAMPGMEFLDYIARAGFFPGVHVMLPIVLFGAVTGKPEFGQLAPAWMRTGLSGLRALSPQHIGKILEHIYPDRFRDYMTMLTLGTEGYNADEIWRKKQGDEKITPEEEKLWLDATNRVDGIKGILMQQTGLFRIRPAEFTEIRKEMRLAIEEATGVPISVQEQIDQNYPVTGKRFSDYYKLDVYQQKLLYEWETYRRWQGVTTPLYPSSWQLLDVKIRDYYEAVEKVYEDARNVGTYEDGELVRPSIIEANRQWVEGEIGPDQWKSLRSDIQGGLAEAVRILGESPAYKDVPKTFEERATMLEERGIPTPTQTPDQELLYYYYELRPEYKWNWESQRMERDFDTYYAYIDILLESLDGPHRERLLERIQSDWTPLEKLYWNISRDFMRPYRNLRDIVLQQYSPEEIQQIRRFEVAPAAEREALKEVIGPEGDKLISSYQRRLREARQRLRILDPDMDSWLNFFGVTTKLLSTEAEETYEELRKKYLIKAMIQ